MIRVFVVEDEYISRERIKRFLQSIPDIEIVGEAESKSDAIKKIKELEPDVLILDIKLPDGTGIELAKEVLESGLEPYIIFATAYGDYAVEAFKVNAIDYILKPYELSDVENAISKVKSAESKKNNILNISKLIHNENEFLIPVKHLNKIILLKPEDIYYIKAELSETIIRTADNEYFSNKKLYEFENLLKPKGFFKIHKSYIVNLAKIKEMKLAEQSKFVIYFNGISDTLKTSRDGAKALREYLGL
ncbi:MAG: LytR/AlgR family response regulator transcription factor [Sulfurihydrogenibium sp.]|jgi:two-component system LytT family response regulator/two-component system response regulator LytT|uniref:LytR/AlgR family response regulator transcription factor n=1 Tax=Sulfurihydrogenibium sp. TaxID=2053621 RepID=UPI0026A568E8